jgi:hypothetical protein
MMIGATCLGAAGAAVLAVGFAMPVELPVTASPAPRGSATSLSKPVQAQTGRTAFAPQSALDELQRLSAVDLRAPLFDPPPALPAPAAEVPVAHRSTMTLRLVGTIVEPGHSMAMFQKPDGSIALCAQGQSIDEAAATVTVTHVSHHRVTVQFAGQSIELDLPEAPACDPVRGAEP